MCWKASKASNDVNYDELTKCQTVRNANDDVMHPRWRGVRLENIMPPKICSSDNLTLTLI